MLACNATGTEKLKPLVIVSSISPRTLFCIFYNTLPVIYRANSRAWMRNDIFLEWLKDLDQRFRIQNCQVLLLVDNASSHFHDQSNIDNINELRGSDESNVNSEEEIFDNNLEPEYQPLYAGIVEVESNSRSYRGNRGNRSNRGSRSGHRGHGGRRDHGTGGSMGRYGSGYGNPRPISDYSSVRLTNIKLEFLPPNTISHLQPMDSWDTIENSVINNCWNKTGILPLVSHEKIELATCTQDAVLEQQEQDISTLVVDLTSQDPDPEIEDQLNTYLDLNNLHIVTEKNLDDSEIIEVVLDEANQFEHGDPNDSDEEEPEISISERLIGLNKFICFFEQQTDPDFKAEDLKSFQKYLTLINRKYNESKHQTSTVNFFMTQENSQDYDN
ncbi:3363_t:CDS:2 [Gigaspora rosea]|nr:3363_t:CDS:2 [Gigaspora rosea]